MDVVLWSFNVSLPGRSVLEHDDKLLSNSCIGLSASMEGVACGADGTCGISNLDGVRVN